MVNAEAVDAFKKEAVLLLSLKPHPAIVQVLGISTDKNSIFVVMEFCDRGSLDKLMEKQKLTIEEKLHILHTVAAGIAHLHRERVVHRDIAARNILISSPLKAKVAEYPFFENLLFKPKHLYNHGYSLTAFTALACLESWELSSPKGPQIALLCGSHVFSLFTSAR